MALITNNIYFELMPNDNLFMVPICRPLFKVIEERTKVATYVSSQTGCKIEVLSGICDITKADIKFNKKDIMMEKTKFPVHLRLQDQIDIYNDITAEQVIIAYRKQLDKETDEKIDLRFKALLSK